MSEAGAKILVCGGRDYNDRETVFRFLDSLEIDCIIHGGAPGADRISGVWAAMRGVPARVFYADWSQGKKAGPLRNQRMLDEGKPDAVVAFPGGRGTADMKRRAEAAGITVYCVNDPP